MNAFVAACAGRQVVRKAITTLQVNVGDLCNLSCRHCHVQAGPGGKHVISRTVLQDILDVLDRRTGIETVDITGGAPELVPDINWFLEELIPRHRNVIWRTNLTALLLDEMDRTSGLLRDIGAEIVASLPCYTLANVEAQRGTGVFARSIRAIRQLNEMGYGRDKGLVLTLMYNPGGAFLPGSQEGLEKDYKRELAKNHGIRFTRLFAMTNAPIGRFRKELERAGKLEDYENLLKAAYNPGNLDHVMCLDTISVGHDGRLFDCDFNLALGLPIADPSIRNIAELKSNRLETVPVVVGNQCFTCTAGSGTSCTGSLSCASPKLVRQ